MEIIPGLPEDLGMQCLARVPYRFHANLRAVSKSWNALLNCSHLSEEGLVSLHISRRIESDFDVIIYYPLGKWWERLPQIPREFEFGYTIHHHCVFVRSTQQLVVVGLLNRRSDTKGVLIFGFLSRKWRLGADMPHDRYFFACDASPTEGLVYIAGGYHRPTYSPYLEGFVYNVEGNKWDFLPPMNSDYVADADLCAGVFLDDKFYAAPCESQRAQVYDPHTRLCNNINTDSNADYTHSCVAALEGFGLTWNNCARSWIYAKEIDIVSNSETRAGRFAAATSRGYFFVSVVECTNRVEYYTFNSWAREER